MGNIILHDLHVAKDEAGVLHFYKDGVYVSHGDDAVGEMYLKYLRAMNWEHKWSMHLETKIIAYITRDAKHLLDRPEFNRINLLNGIYDIYKPPELAFGPSSPDYLTTVQIPIRFDPEATCPRWDRFLWEVFPEGVELLYEIVGMCMIPFTKIQKCIVLLGTGNNGKGVFLRGLEAAIGTDNVSNVPITKLHDRFSTSMLVGKLINVFGDLPMRALEETSVFKALTGEDSITVEYKGKQGFRYRPFCRYIFSTNKRVEAKDDASSGFLRRFLEIPFTRVFDSDPKKGEALEEGLKDPDELSGVFNRVRLLLPNLIENGFTITEQVAQLVENFIPIPPNILIWLKNNICEAESAAMPVTAFWNYYVTNCPTPDDGNGFDKVKLIAYLKAAFPNMIHGKTVRYWSGEKPARSYWGIRLIKFEDQKALLDQTLKWQRQRGGDLDDL